MFIVVEVTISRCRSDAETLRQRTDGLARLARGVDSL
jgi:hypothetical protein